ncbi:A-kinase anchor protein inhibitor 1 [Ornithorhynchus anatinus]|nr:A-kinase anchor protein inhibitor 1 [Ornithorhynchus anatinus]
MLCWREPWPRTQEMWGVFFKLLLACYMTLGEKPGNEPEEVKLQNASKRIVQQAILRAVRQVSQENQQSETRAGHCRTGLQPGAGEVTQKPDEK